MGPSAPRSRTSLALVIGGAVFTASLLLTPRSVAAAEPETGPTPEPAPASAHMPNTPPPATAHLLQPGDVVEITVFEHQELRLKTRVDVDGTIRFPLVGVVHVAGKSPGMVSEMLSKRLLPHIERAQVFVFVSQYVPRRVYVLGQVSGVDRKAMEIPPDTQLTALQAISAVGGFGPQADLGRVFVLRRRPGGTIEELPVDVRGILGQQNKNGDILLRPGDTIFVPRARPVSVLGMVNQPNAFTVDTANPITVSEMISRASGFREGADRDHTLLLRPGSNGRLQAYVVRLGRVMQGDVRQDARVHPGDTIIARARDKIFVLGKVNAPGAFELQPGVPMTVTRAVALAGGFANLAAEDAVLLIRGGRSRRVDLRKSLRPGVVTETDLALEAGDILYVNESRW